MAFTLKDLTTSYDISSEGTLHVGGELLGGFKSGTLTFSADQVDNSTRDDQGWGKSAPGLRNATLEVTFNKLETDACHDIRKGRDDRHERTERFKLHIFGSFQS